MGIVVVVELKSIHSTERLFVFGHIFCMDFIGHHNHRIISAKRVKNWIEGQMIESIAKFKLISVYVMIFFQINLLFCDNN